MRKILLLGFILCMYSFIYSQNTVACDIENEIGQLNKEVSFSNQKIDLLQKEIDSVQQEISGEKLDRVFNRWMSIQQLFIAFLSLLSILLPLLTYFFGFKPAKDAEKRIEKIEADFDSIVKQRLEKYINDKDLHTMKNAIMNLLSEDQEQRAMATNYINLNQYYQIDDIDRKYIYEKLIDPSVSEQVKSSMKLLLANAKSIWADLYFENIIINEKDFMPNLFFIMKYIALNGFGKKRDKFILSFKNYMEKYQIFSTLLLQCSSISEKALYELANDVELIDLINVDELKNISGFLQIIENTYRIELSETYLKKKII